MTDNNIFNFSKALEKIAEALANSTDEREKAEKEALTALYHLSLNPQRQAIQFLIAVVADKRFNKIRAKVAETAKALSNFERVVQVKSKSGKRWLVVTTDEQPLSFSEPVREFYKKPVKTEWSQEDYEEAVKRFNSLWKKRLKKEAEQA